MYFNMATREQLEQKTYQLIEDVVKIYQDKIKKAFDSGAFDVEDYDNNFLLPKTIICAISKEIERQFEPPMTKDKKMVNNIYRMI